jgi:hypothetical protein
MISVQRAAWLQSGFEVMMMTLIRSLMIFGAQAVKLTALSESDLTPHKGVLFLVPML